jgi:hypothetical protein
MTEEIEFIQIVLRTMIWFYCAFRKEFWGAERSPAMLLRLFVDYYDQTPTPLKYRKLAFLMRGQITLQPLKTA